MGSFQCVCLAANDVLSEILPKKLQQLNEAGLIEYYMRYYFDAVSKIVLRTESGSKVLTLEELEAGFVVCMIPMGISLVAFCIEWLITLKHLTVYQFIFKKLFDSSLSSQQAAFKIWIKKLKSNKKIKEKKQEKGQISYI